MVVVAVVKIAQHLNKFIAHSHLLLNKVHKVVSQLKEEKNGKSHRKLRSPKKNKWSLALVKLNLT